MQGPCTTTEKASVEPEKAPSIIEEIGSLTEVPGIIAAKNDLAEAVRVALLCRPVRYIGVSVYLSEHFEQGISTVQAVELCVLSIGTLPVFHG